MHFHQLHNLRIILLRKAHLKLRNGQYQLPFFWNRQYRLDVTGKLAEGKNTLQFIFKSPAEEAVRRAGKYPYKVPYVAVRPSLPVRHVDRIGHRHCATLSPLKDHLA